MSDIKIESSKLFTEAALATQERSKSDKWVRTKQCWCPPTAGTDCRYHSPSEPGWQTCPYKDIAPANTGRWLWSSTKLPLSDAELSIGAKLQNHPVVDD